MLARILSKPLTASLRLNSCRSLSFSFAGPRKLDDIIKKELVDDKDTDELSAIWNQYHEGKEGVVGLQIKGQEGIKVLSRAKSW